MESSKSKRDIWYCGVVSAFCVSIKRRTKNLWNGSRPFHYLPILEQKLDMNKTYFHFRDKCTCDSKQAFMMCNLLRICRSWIWLQTVTFLYPAIVAPNRRIAFQNQIQKLEPKIKSRGPGHHRDINANSSVLSEITKKIEANMTIVSWLIDA